MQANGVEFGCGVTVRPIHWGRSGLPDGWLAQTTANDALQEQLKHSPNPDTSTPSQEGHEVAGCLIFSSSLLASHKRPGQWTLQLIIIQT